jgi:hypothetical protein
MAENPPILFIILAALTLIVLITGVLIMARGGKTNEKYSNKLMIARVALQATAIAALALLYLCSKK